jgi:hypothetical protein
MNRSGADLERLRCFEDARASRQLRPDALDNIRAHWTTKPLALASCPREASLDALDDHRALELGKDAEHLEHRLARWRAGIETLLMQVKVDALRVQFTEERHQIL